MRSLLGTLTLMLVTVLTHAQFTIKGRISSGNEPVQSATVSLEREGSLPVQVATSANGSYEITTRSGGTYQLNVKHLNYQPKTVDVNLSGSVNEVNVDVERSAYFLQPIEVTSIRASERAPFTKTNISKAEIEKLNLGQDLPFLLNQTPGIVVNSDAGNGVGYTGMRIRGSDATRINVTINGIPYNDPESQGVFLVNMPDFASSVNSIQIQRGVGTSSNGAGAFGATLNLSTNEFNPAAYGEFNNSFGSFNTRKHTIKAGSGLINDHFTVDARLSKITSDGYIDRASSDLQSFYFSTAYIAKKSSVRLNIFSGNEKTYQAWNGVSEDMLKTNRRFNSAGTARPGSPYENETDNYQQDHYQLFFNHSFTDNLTFNTGLFLVNGEGYYEQYRARQRFSAFGLPNPIMNGAAVTRTDAIRRLWLDNSFYGQIASINYKKGADNITVGGGWNTYEGQHFGTVIWAEVGIPKDHRFYDNKGLKKDANVYAKWQRALNNRWELFTDLQYRHVTYTATGFRNNPNVPVDRKFDFINPKAGISYSHKGWQGYFSYAVGTKEPNREDFEAGIARQPNPETLHDFELGIERKTSTYSYGATAYYMLYKNQLILTGQINDVGAYTRVNIPNSFRTGVELQGAVRINQWLQASANVAISKNKINEWDEFIDNYDANDQQVIKHSNTDISFSPSVVSASTITITPIKFAEINLLSKYVSRQYLDNTQNVARSLNPYFVQDVRLSYTIKNKLLSNVQVIGMINNVFNEMYEANGYTFSYIAGGAFTTENFYFPMAGTNYMVGLNIRL
ncbi:TonB-dependent receptor [Aridibaculum aurantiacum]|uniref:TonB-dependent receptor n=1 Tax=Aridibaculum aurantiacum TaxID=2810307 RepID=UPI001A96448F|nr:TonB-dependent receptor plug domain-containing protein [Aridibaculum aurantiacum]